MFLALRLGPLSRHARQFSIVVIGAPGSGKGTICKRITEHFDFQHISSGDLLRSHVLENTDIGKFAASFINKGCLVPDDVIIDMVMEEVKSKKSSSILLDGFPRTKKQAELLDARVPVNQAINFEVPYPIIVDRISKRWIHLPSGRVYNEDFNPPKQMGIDDLTGEELVRREDDLPEAVEARLSCYDEMIKPVKEYYKSGKLLVHFRGNTTNEIWPHIYKFIAKYQHPLSKDRYDVKEKNKDGLQQKHLKA